MIPETNTRRLIVTNHLWNSMFNHSLVAQTVKNLPAKHKTQVQSLDEEGLLEKEMAKHSCLENSMDREACPWDHKDLDTADQLPLRS